MTHVMMRRTPVYCLAAVMVGGLLFAGCRKKTDSPPAAEPTPAAKPAKKSADKLTKKAETEPAKEQVAERVKKPATEPAVQPTKEPAKTTEKKRARQSAKDPTKKSAKERTRKPGRKREKETASEPTKKPGAEPANEPVKKPAAEPAKEPPKKPAVEPAKEPAEKPAVEPAKGRAKDKELDLADRLLAAPEAVEIGGRTLTLETYLWRDFMPISPPDGKPLIATVTVVAKGATAFPSGANAVRMWVIKDRDVWEGKFSQDAAPPQPGRLERTAREGPKWGPGIEVDVVVELTDDEGNKYLLRAAKQKIDRTS